MLVAKAQWAGVSGKGNRIIPRWPPKSKEKRTSETNYLSYATFPTPLVSLWSLPLIAEKPLL
jgi:hypothetical protein